MYLNHDVQFILCYSIIVYLIYGYNKQYQLQNTHIIFIYKQKMLSMKLAYNSVNTNYELDLCKFAIC